jgi:autotransporter-associated beta strand protein
MKPTFKPMKNRLFLPTLLTIGLATGGAHAANFVQTATDAGGTSSFTDGTNFPGGAPSNTNTYQTGAFRIRTINGTASNTFGGISLEIQAGLGFRNKSTGTTTVNNLIVADKGVLELSQPGGTNGATSVGTLEGNITLNGTGIIVAGNNTDSALHTYTLSAAISGSGGLTTGDASVNLGGTTATSNGTVVLTAANSYIGGTSVTTGTLRVNNTTGSGTGAGTVTVSTTGTLGGTGSISGATTVNGNLAPGAGVGKLTFTGGLTLGSLVANSLKFELGANTTAGTTYDTVATSALDIGTLDFDDFQFTNTGALAAGTYTLISSTAPITGSIGTASGVIPGFTGSGTLSISGGNTLVLTVSGVADVTAPSWVATYPKVGTVTSSGFNALAAINENGTAYFLVLPDGDPAPTSATVQTTGTAISLTANVEGSSTVIGLVPSTSYDVYFVAQDATPNLQASPVKVDVTTTAFVAANFVMSGSDAGGTSSFNAGTNWAAGTPSGAANLAPSAGNTYQTSAFRIRTPSSGTIQEFVGESLEIQAGGNMRNKTAATVTIGNFILADTAVVELSQPNGQNGALSVGTLAGNISLTGGSATFMAGNPSDSPLHVFTISSDISGAGGINTGTGSTLTGGGVANSIGTVVFTGANTYTGATTVSAGTLSLVGGSQTSPITVNSGATLGFEVGSPTTSSSTVTFDATSKVSVTGTPAAVTLMTASSISGTPVLDPAIPGFTLQITATELKLVSGGASPYGTWAASYLPTDVSNPAGDNDNDGLVNQQEFAYGLNPTSGASVNPIIVQLNKTAGTFSYQRRAGTGLTYKILKSATLAAGSWVEDAGAVQVVIPSGENENVVVTLSGAPLTGDKLFVRVAAE